VCENGTDICHETSVRKYQYSLRNDPEEHSSCHGHLRPEYLFRRVKRLGPEGDRLCIVQRLRISGAVPPLQLYIVMTWTCVGSSRLEPCFVCTVRQTLSRPATCNQPTATTARNSHQKLLVWCLLKMDV
jgi:hypothetical protein